MAYCIGEAKQVADGKVWITEVEGISIGIFRRKNKYYAIRNVCPHKLAPVCKGTVGGTMVPEKPCVYRYGMEDKVLKCPWHGWEFDIDSGQAVFGISNRKVKTYRVETKDGKLYIDLT